MFGKEVYRPMKKALIKEQKNLLPGFVGFSAAILILFIEGSICPLTYLGVIALCLLAASIPIGVIAYLLSVKVLTSEASVPLSAHKRSDDVATIAISLSFLGFFLLLFEAAPLYGLVLLSSFFLSVFYLVFVAYSWERGANMDALNGDAANKPEE